MTSSRWQPLTWADVDPARHPFDPAQALAMVHAVAPPVPAEPDWSWVEAMGDALADRYGRWTRQWSGSPDGDWCCPGHSVTTQTATEAVVARSLVGWRVWLEDLAGRFDRFLPLPGPDADPDDQQAAWEVAVAHLVTTTAGRVGDDGWPGFCRMVLGWFLTAAGLPPGRHEALTESVIGGHFSSYTQPTAAQVADIAEDLARTLAGDRSGGLPAVAGSAAEDLPDTWPHAWPSWRTYNRPAGTRRPLPEAPRRLSDLAAWRDVRTRVDWRAAARPTPGPVAGDRDGMAAYAARRGDDSRGLLTALSLARQAATEGEPLTFARLAGWQRHVLGVPDAPSRTGWAAAKNGREGYAWEPGLPAAFEQCLTEATTDDLPLASRAARLYLDVAFFHPFDDGNARAAAVAVYFLLARDGVVLDRAAPLLMTVRRADDAFGAAGLAGLIETLIRSAPGAQDG